MWTELWSFNRTLQHRQTPNSLLLGVLKKFRNMYTRSLRFFNLKPCVPCFTVVNHLYQFADVFNLKRVDIVYDFAGDFSLDRIDLYVLATRNNLTGALHSIRNRRPFNGIVVVFRIRHTSDG